jgi:hypothetical protein
MAMSIRRGTCSWETAFAVGSILSTRFYAPALVALQNPFAA